MDFSFWYGVVPDMQQACQHARPESDAGCTGNKPVFGASELTAHRRGDSAYFGRVQLSDHARQELEEGLPKRSIRNTWPSAALPLTVSCALRAGREGL